ncbi:hypothetical protein [Ralstonia pseudosolanacearum]|uniref:hypothetical protein n=1 Tax=Ralstonia pseudosolanacearum TaxID=1310165 RepID=UPI003AAFDF73
MPLALVSVAIIAMTDWLVHLQHQDERAAANLHALEQRLAARATPIHLARVAGQTLYSCTTKTGFIYTAPTEAEMRGLCERS